MAASGSTERLALADWKLRTPPFGEVRVYDDVRAFPVMSLEPALSRELETPWRELCELWMDLRMHPNMLDAIDVDGSVLWLRYAAIDWRRRPFVVDEAEFVTTRIAASIGFQLCDVYRALERHLLPRELGLCANPIVCFDIDGRPRLAFQPVPAPVKGVDDLVSVVCRLFSQVVTIGGTSRASRVAAILERCREGVAASHYANLDALATAFEAAGSSALAVRSDRHLEAWQHIEEGVGWLAVARLYDALTHFSMATTLVAGSHIAMEGLARVRAADDRITLRPVTPAIAWETALVAGAVLERQRSFAHALSVYRTVNAAAHEVAALQTAIGRCHLRLNDIGAAIEAADRAIASDATHVEAYSVLTAGLHLRGRHIDAIAATDRWLAIAHDDAGAHYARGLALFALRRRLEARESFEKALALRPAMIEAMVLRREVDRAVGAVRAVVGTDNQPVTALPEQLAAIRDALVAGDLDAVVETLARPEHARDVLAQLIRARCLLQLVRVDDALAVVDAVLAVDPDHLDAIELRAQVFVHLGRTEDADAEYRRFIARAEAASDPRVRDIRRRLAKRDS